VTCWRKSSRIPSVTPEEREAAEHLVDFFESHGREAWIDDVGNVRAPADDGVLLTSHVDTVPGDIPVRIEENDEGEEALWGRGSVDAKGPLCAMAVAAVRTGASFVGVVGEEVDSRGGRFLVEDRDSAPDAVVNGEPSGWKGITLGYRGLLAGTYVATSESGHSSRPENNAIQDAIDWWAAVDEEFEPDDWVPVFERVTTKPVSMDGGISADGLSVEATMDVQRGCRRSTPPRRSADRGRSPHQRHRPLGRQGRARHAEPADQRRPRVPGGHPRAGRRPHPAAQDRDQRHERLRPVLGLPDGHLRPRRL